MHHSLADLKTKANNLWNMLASVQSQHEPDERYRGFLREQAEMLQEALRNAATPETYRVAVVGSFKVGKSSFVNALCDVPRLVSVAANPETAAVTTLRYSSQATASIQMITRDAWEFMRGAYGADQNDPAAVRYAAMRKKEKDGELVLPGKDPKEKVRISIDELEQRYLRDEAFVQEIKCGDWSDNKARIAFSKEISAFTSQSSPAHFFVDRLDVSVPVPFLRDGIELIDTPGLDDPDRYRVRITEQLVEDVDVILFLTQSGRAYSQQDKEFITTQLRKGKLKHLMLIVTRCDETFANACKDAEEVGDEPPTFEEHLKREEERLRAQIRTTLDELLTDPKLRDDLGMFYMEKLLDIRVNFTSAHDYAEAKKQKDPGQAQELLYRSGIEKLRTDLAEMLAQSERIVRAKHTLNDAIERSVERIIRTFRARLDAASTEFNAERVRDQLTQIDVALAGRMAEFQTAIQEQVRLFRERNQADQALAFSRIDVAGRDALDVIRAEFEIPDMARHWKSRRNRGWGGLYDLQHKIANRIFPQVEITLMSYSKRFKQLVEQTRADLRRFELTIADIESTTGLDNMQPLALAELFDQTYQQKLNELGVLVGAQRDAIVSHLDNFVSDEVEEKIDEARDNVADEWGRGTTARQNSHITDFYGFLRTELKRELEKYLQKSVKTFVGTLEKNAGLIYPDLKRSLNQSIEDHRKAIESTLAERNAHERAALLAYLEQTIQAVKPFQN
ncbi:hypothetical protein SE17_05905 [Kouleothrix aurantiaca]|uniref:Dynamin N-terminal domain-containing protein n=1 Tax=Kouleothrix aurantiaca TaxID=186479 RepID=A0A0P9DEF4_9CHLR|nr:hypothetical protein SE17_05905 [Kouleothrix aurantiaca]